MSIYQYKRRAPFLSGLTITMQQQGLYKNSDQIHINNLLQIHYNVGRRGCGELEGRCTVFKNRKQVSGENSRIFPLLKRNQEILDIGPYGAALGAL
jgi:hypothetical protein